MSYVYSGEYEYEVRFTRDGNADVKVRYRRSPNRNFTDLGIVCKYRRTGDGIELFGDPLFAVDEVVTACNIACARRKVLARVRDHYDLHSSYEPKPDERIHFDSMRGVW